MIHRIFRYLFPRIRTRDKLPLLSIRYSSQHSKTRATPAEIEMLKLAGLARTDADAARLRNKHRGISATQIVKKLRKPRRRKPWLRAWKRFKKLW